MPAHKKPVLPAVGPSAETLRRVRKGVKRIKAAAEFIGGSKTMVRKLLDDGVLTSFFVGRCRVIPKEDLIAFLADQMESQLEDE